MFAGFSSFDRETSGATIHGVRSGSGPAVLLLHGIPQTHLMWRFVAPLLARDFTVVATDLRGYGSSGCLPGEDPRRHGMRELAREQREVMAALGHERFAVVGHDRGARCAYRMALDHPDTVTALSVLDVVPTGEVFARADAEFALGFWVWSFLAAPSPIPETMINSAPDVFVDHMLDGWAAPNHAVEAEVRSSYRQQFHDPERVATICQQYRAAATADRADDEADRDRQRKVRAPVQVLWSQQGAVEAWYDPIEMWKRWADDVDGQSLSCGHFLPEEQPDLTARLLRGFLENHIGPVSVEDTAGDS
ncbi:alpha/beta hydrolase [Amycolatopsis antarctica]|uniref:Alpha/beta hydrolase n=1 Tax=Amycolatopsis antarctica TaxID=1854586 RepID=A0A263CW50_9PSEU|nr:alpha/beta hydrolase [Amycolatopsis antarctica]OZM70362.1 alpha/beta hydrolase [Amycolatopsis antarctica]